MTKKEKAQFCIDNPRKSPAFQFYSDHWFGSRHVAAMTDQQRGIHASLIFAAWLEENCGIPKSDIILAIRSREPDMDFLEKNTYRVLEWCWFLYIDFYFNERLLNERIKQIELSNTRKKSGLQGGRPKESKLYKEKPIDNQMDSKHKAKETKCVDVVVDVVVEEKEEEKEIKINPIYRECSDILKSRILEKRKAVIDELKLIKWDRVVKLMIEKDKYSQREIIDTINACHDMPPNAGGFTWADNILSMATLREKMKEGKIYPKMNIGRNQGKERPLNEYERNAASKYDGM